MRSVQQYRKCDHFSNTFATSHLKHDNGVSGTRPNVDMFLEVRNQKYYNQILHLTDYDVPGLHFWYKQIGFPGKWTKT